MPRKIQKWEEEYRLYNSGEKEKRFNELCDKENNKTITKEEYKELEKITKIGKNLKKVRNVISFRDELEEMQKKVEDELIAREQKDVASFTAKINKLEQELAILEQEKAKLEDKLKDESLSDEDKYKIKDELKANQVKREINNDKYLKYYMANTKNEKTKTEFAKMSEDELKSLHKKICVKLSKCNLYAKKLMQGATIDSIKAIEAGKDWESNYKLDVKKLIGDRKKLVAKEAQAEKSKSLRGTVKEDNTKNNIAANVEEIINEERGKHKKEIERKEDLPVEISEFDQKHPRLARIVNWFKDKFRKGKDRVSEAEYYEEENPINVKRNKFITSVKDIDKYEINDIAEKGIRGTKIQNAAKTLLENQKNARGETDPETVRRLERLAGIENKDNDGR